MKTLPISITGELFIDEHYHHGPRVRIDSRALGDILRDAGIWVQREPGAPWVMASKSFGRVRIMIDTVPATQEREERT